MSSPTTPTASKDAVGPEETGEVGKLLIERLRAWKHAVAYLEEYVEATETLHKGLSKDYHKVLKTIDEPLKEGHHFDQTVGGFSSLFENLRANTAALGATHTDTATSLKSHVLPILERLHKELKDRQKHVESECSRALKAVAKTRAATQSHIELLTTHASTFSSVGIANRTAASSGSKIKPDNDPYLLKRGVLHRLAKQVSEENALQNDLIGVEKHFEEFETHVVETIQSAIKELNLVLATGREREGKLYADSATKALAIPSSFEYTNFLTRNASILIPYDAPPRNISDLHFPNQDHPSTTSLMSGGLQRKGKLLRSYSSSYYILTPSGFLHEFKDQDSANYSANSDPEMSLYLPDCVVGGLKEKEGKFVISGKDAGSRLSGKHDFAFKCGTGEEARRWYEAIERAAGLKSGGEPSPISPVGTGLSQEEGTKSPVVAVGGAPPGYEKEAGVPEKAAA